MKKILLVLAIVATAARGFAEGYYVEMKISSGGQTVADMKLYAQDENTRTEMNTDLGGMGKMNIVMLTLKSAPKKMYMLDTKAKTYSEMDESDTDQYGKAPKDGYEVTVLGKEKVNGYNCTHIKVKIKDVDAPMEMWTTTELSDYKSLSLIRSKYTGNESLYKELEAKGVSGFPVRIKTTEMGQVAQIDLVKVEHKTLDSGLFSLTGYTKKETAAPMGLDYQKMIKEMQNMTPEERERIMKMMQQQYQNQPK